MSTPRTAIFLQNACLSHRYIRNSDTSTVVERPERVRAVKIGLAAAIARIKEINSDKRVDGSHASDLSDPAPTVNGLEPDHSAGDLTAALEQMRLDSQSGPFSTPSHEHGHEAVDVIHSSAKINILNHSAVKYIHGDIDGDIYLENLLSWAKASEQKIAEDGTEIPEGLSQGDLYRESPFPFTVLPAYFR
jgi:histone deacetylase HOS3